MQVAHGHWPLEAHASIAGTITDDNPLAVPHARVCAEVSNDEVSRGLARTPRCTFTDDHGHYEIVDLFAIEYRVTAVADHHLPSELAPIVLHPGERHDGADLVLFSGGVEVSGTVSDRGGVPIAHARVDAAWTENWAHAPMVECDDVGVFHMWTWPGQIAITATADGYAGEFAFGAAPGVFQIALTPASSISGTVTDGATHVPAADVTVEVGGHDATTDEQGRFRVEGLHPGRYVATSVADHRYGSSDGSVVVALGEHVDDVAVTLYPVARIEVIFLVADATRMSCPRPSFGLVPDRGRNGGWTHGGSGTLALDGILPGTYRVHADCEGYERVDGPETIVVTERDAQLTWHFDRGATIRGHIRDAVGAPVAGAAVSSASARDVSKADGSFALTGLPAGKSCLVVIAATGVQRDGCQQLELAPGSQVIQDVALVSGGTIAGTVSDSSGEPVAETEVMIDWRDYPKAVSDKDGHFQLANVPAGSYRVFIMQPGQRDLRQETVVRANQTSIVNFVVEVRAGKITGTVTDASGKPVADASIDATRDGDERANSAGQAFTSSDGTFVLARLQSGSYRLDARRVDGGEATAEHVAIGGTTRLQLKAPGSIAGVVRTTSGTPIDLEVRLDESRREYFYRTDGRFHFEGVTAGTYHLRASDGYADGDLAVDVAEGGHVTGLAIQLDGGVTVGGRVVDLVTRLPVVGAKVSAGLRDGLSSQSAITGSDGRFVIDHVPRHRVCLRPTSG